MPKNLIGELAAASPNRRSFLKTIGAATAGVTALSVAGVMPAKAATATEVEVLNFALNLEYLEAEFYTYAVYGKGIEYFGIKTSGTANGANSTSGGTTTGGKIVKFTNNEVGHIASQIGGDERSHVLLLREALGSAAIAKPDINLNALGLLTGVEDDYLRQARIFEGIGVSAYGGAAGLLSTPSVITTAARILAVEALHTGSLHTQIYLYGVTTSALDGADLIPPPSGPVTQILPVNASNGLPAVRTPGEVLYLAFGAASATSGGFFPTGVNGAITTSSASPATSANLSTSGS